MNNAMMNSEVKMNEAILNSKSLCGSVVSASERKSKGLRFDSSLGLRMFSLSHARDKTKNIFLNSSPSSKLTISTISIEF